jgi:hypothetical protein
VNLKIKALFLACGIAVSSFVLATPEWGFDIVCYAGAARTWLGETPAQAHANVYRELELTAPWKEAEAIRSLSEYREGVANSVEQFAVQLPMYTVKPLYVGLVAAGVMLGGNSLTVQFWISAVAYGCFAILLLLALARVASVPVALAMGAALLLSPTFREVGQMPNPDALSALVVFGGFYALILARRPLLGIALLLVSIGVRPNNLLFALAIAVWWAWKDRLQSAQAALAGSAGVVIYVIVNRVTSAYPWGVLFTHTYLRRLTDVASVRSDVTMSSYLGTLLPGLGGAGVLYPSVMLIFVAISVLAFVVAKRSENPSIAREAMGLQLAIWGAVVLHFLAFPMLADRFFMVHYAAVTVLTLSVIGAKQVPVQLSVVKGVDAAA